MNIKQLQAFALTTVIIGIVLAISLALVFALHVNSAPMPDKADATRSACQTLDKHYCEQVQAKYHTEYLCNANNNDCWVEVNY